MLAICVALLLQTVPAAQDYRIAVFITAPTRDGFVDTGKDVQDSIKDIRNEMKGMKELRLVDRAEDADVILIVVTRGVGSQAYGTRTTARDYGQIEVATTPILANTFWLSTVLQAGTYKKEFTGTHTQESAYSLGAWQDVAERVAKEVRAWAKTNADQLRNRRQKASG